ncbi:DNA-binding transcriptional regulator, MarR family [Ekhidna lutea]|uniref:DNA-binding transcriptional regulator, MarR family n=1 Tax=Ekhidna lutea TaxID=447679 RepID=A0A239HI43_EKHLU|nr:MarR family transcriptional regulator [Ekhidna lutea]SNS80503.1 DNA-binding transcriptional regulator, MarR family [Ekhidna lutea]
MSQYKELGSFIDRTYKVVRQDLINRFKNAGVDITPEQWVILNKLSEKDMFQTDLASMSFRDKPTVSRIVDLLVKKNLVERIRDKLDGRKYHVKITPKGNNVIRKATPAVEASRKLGWTNLSDQEYETLIATLDKIFTNYSERDS